jgi:hypothetical protein
MVDPAQSLTGLDLPTIVLASVVLGVLAIASIVARNLSNQQTPSINPALVQRFVQRLWAWYVPPPSWHDHPLWIGLLLGIQRVYHHDPN